MYKQETDNLKIKNNIYFYFCDFINFIIVTSGQIVNKRRNWFEKYVIVISNAQYICLIN